MCQKVTSRMTYIVEKSFNYAKKYAPENAPKIAVGFTVHTLRLLSYTQFWTKPGLEKS